MDRSEYFRYLASREWTLLKNRLHKRSGGICERCKGAKAAEAHHLTYERIGRELLTDLIHLCSMCHRFLSGKLEFDPIDLPYFKDRRALAEVGHLSWEIYVAELIKVTRARQSGCDAPTVEILTTGGKQEA